MRVVDSESVPRVPSPPGSPGGDKWQQESPPLLMVVPGPNSEATLSQYSDLQHQLLTHGSPQPLALLHPDFMAYALQFLERVRTGL